MAMLHLRPAHGLAVAGALAFAGPAFADFSVQLNNYSGYVACYATNKPTIDPTTNREITNASGWQCEPNNSGYLVNVYGGTRVYITVYLVIPGQGPLNYVDRDPQNREIYEIPVPQSFDFGKNYFVTFYRDDTYAWHYTYSLDTSDPNGTKTAVSPSRSSYGSLLPDLGFQNVDAWYFGDHQIVTIKAP